VNSVHLGQPTAFLYERVSAGDHENLPASFREQPSAAYYSSGGIRHLEGANLLFQQVDPLSDRQIIRYAFEFASGDFLPDCDGFEEQRLPVHLDL
jgi:hypothetical protein